MSADASYGGNSAGSRRVDPRATITPQQLELLALYASGCSYEEIASIKFFSYDGVRKSLARAVERSGAKNLTNLVAASVEARMLRSDGAGKYEPVQDLRVVNEEESRRI